MNVNELYDEVSFSKTSGAYIQIHSTLKLILREGRLGLYAKPSTFTNILFAIVPISHYHLSHKTCSFVFELKVGRLMVPCLFIC